MPFGSHTERRKWKSEMNGADKKEKEQETEQRDLSSCVYRLKEGEEPMKEIEKELSRSRVENCSIWKNQKHSRRI